MAKYTEDFKYRVVQEYLEGLMGCAELGKKYGLSYAMIERWVGWHQAHGLDGLKKKFSHYSAEFKLSVLTHLWENAWSYRQTGFHFNIRNPSILAQWARIYREGGIDALQPRRTGRPPTMSAKAIKPSENEELTLSSHETLVKELNYLRLENAYLKKFNALVQEKQKLAQEKRRK